VENHDPSAAEPILGKRKGKTPSYPDTPGSFQSYAQRQRQKDQAVVISSGPVKGLRQRVIGYQPMPNPLRELSLITNQFNGLKLDDPAPEKRDIMFEQDDDFKAAKSITTPSQIPRLAPLIPTPFFEFATPSKPSPSSPTPQSKFRDHQMRSTSPQKQFLNRFSNIEAPTPAWDTKGRLEDMESLYAQLKGQMDDTNLERNGLEESVNLYKTRSTLISTSCRERLQNMLQSDSS
jgi:hypothetical protein